MTDALVGQMMAKLVEIGEGSERSEEWKVGRIKGAKKISITLPQGGTTAAAFLFTFQEWNAAGQASGDVYAKISLDVAGCGTKREWVMVEPVRVATGPGRGRRQPTPILHMFDFNLPQLNSRGSAEM